MVATRRGVRVSSRTNTNVEQPRRVAVTPSTGRRTSSVAPQVDSLTRNVPVETSSQLEEADMATSLWMSTLKRCTRASRLQSPEQPCTPVGSVHEADVSDLDSCSSDMEARVRRSSRRKPPSKVHQDEEISEAESCSSLVQENVRSTRKRAAASAVDKKVDSDSEAQLTQNRRSRRFNQAEEDQSEAESCASSASTTRTRRSTRGKPGSHPQLLEDEANKNNKVDLVPEKAVSYQRVAASQRKTVGTRQSAKRQQEDSELSDAESNACGFLETSHSAVRRSTRTGKPICPIPKNLEEVFVSSPRLRRTTRRKTTAEEKSCDSEAFDSGPEYSISTRSRPSRSKTAESDSDLTKGDGTPCTSRTGSGTSRQRAPAAMMKDLIVVLENTVEQSLIDNSVMENTVFAGEADGTLLEEDGTAALEEENNKAREDLCDVITLENEEKKKACEVTTEAKEVEDERLVARSKDLEVVLVEDSVSEDAVFPESKQGKQFVEEKQDDDESPLEEMEETGPSSTERRHEDVSEDEADLAEEDFHVCEPVVASTDQQGEVSAKERKEGDPSAVEVMEETEPSSSQTRCEDIPGKKAETDEIINTQAETSYGVSGKQHAEVEGMEMDELVVQTAEVKPEAPQNSKKAPPKILSLTSSSDDDEEEKEDISEEEDEKGESLSKKPNDKVSSVEGLFMVDTRPGEEVDEDYLLQKLTREDVVGGKDGEADEEFVDEEGDDDGEEDINLLSKNRWLKKMSSSIDPGIDMKQLGGLYITFDGSKSKPGSSTAKQKKKTFQDAVMKKSVMGPDFEKKDAVPPYCESKHILKKKNRAEREKSTGDGWFNMKAPELTKELQGDLQLLKMRGSLDPKRFYKKNDRDGFPKYFQVGTVVDSPVDFYHSRVPKKQRKRTMVEELLADAEFRHKNKKKYQEIMVEKATQAAGKHKYKKNQFHKKSEKVRK